VNSFQTLKVAVAVTEDVGVQMLQLAMMDPDLTITIEKNTQVYNGTVRVFGRNLHSIKPLSFTPLLHLKLLHACDQWH
jgi:hypothetical protein